MMTEDQLPRWGLLVIWGQLNELVTAKKEELCLFVKKKEEKNIVPTQEETRDDEDISLRSDFVEDVFIFSSPSPTTIRII
ncbi:unnamed protein product [Sphagnum tenellum]